MNKQTKNRNKKLAVLISALAAVVFIGIGGTVAYIAASSNNVTNAFDKSKVSCEVYETFENNTKENVGVTNTGDTETYIRLHINVTWEKDDSTSSAQTVSAAVPESGVDYEISFYSSSVSKWEQGNDGYWYYTEPVAKENSTKPLVEKCEILDTANIPSGYHLSVEIIASAIQSLPTSTVEDVWAIEVNNDRTIAPLNQ